MKKCNFLYFLPIYIICICFISSCGKPDYTETIAAAEALIEESYEINKIFFGSGIEMDEESEKNALDKLDIETDVKKVAYAKASSTCGYSSTEKIKNAALRVYSEDYCNIIFSNAFNGRKDDRGNTIEYARYIDDEYGFLTVRINIDDDALTLERTYDLSTIKVIKQKSEYAVIEVESFLNNSPSDKVRLKLVMTDDGWRLDTPTY